MIKKQIVFILVILLCCGCAGAPDVSTSESIPTPPAKTGNFQYTVKDAVEQDDVIIDGHKYEYIVYKEQEKTVRLIAASTKENEWVIPTVINGKKVIALGEDERVDELPFIQPECQPEVWGATKKIHRKKIVIPEGVEVIGDNCFAGIVADEVVLPRSLKVIGSFAFCDTKLRKVTLKSSDTTIKNAAFYLSSLRRIIFPSDYHGKMGVMTFERSGLERFDWPDSNNAVSYENLTYGSSTLMGPDLLYCENLKEIRFPENQKVINISNYALQGCKSLKKLVFPASTEKVIYGNTYYGENCQNSPRTLIFKGKKTKLAVPDENHFVDINGKNKTVLTTGEVIAPKNSEALKAAGQMWKVKEYIQNHIDAIEGRDPYEPVEWNDETIEYVKVKTVARE